MSENNSMHESMSAVQVEWSSAETKVAATSLLDMIIATYIHPSPFDTKKHRSPSPILPAQIRAAFLSHHYCSILQSLRVKMRAGSDGKQWKVHAAPRYALWYIISRLTREIHTEWGLVTNSAQVSLRAHSQTQYGNGGNDGAGGGDLLPMILILVDDHQTDNKVLGLRILLHVVRNSSLSDFRYHSMLLLKVSYIL